MSLSLTDPDFQIDLGYVDLFSGEVHVIAEITTSHHVTRGSRIPFDRIVMDTSRSFSMTSSTFIAPWKGTFTFVKHHFRCRSNERDMYGYIDIAKVIHLILKLLILNNF